MEPIANTDRAWRGAEVVQVYVRRPESQVERADKELKVFEKVWLEPGENTRRASASPSRRSATGTWTRADGRSSVVTPTFSSAARRATSAFVPR